MHTAYGKLSLFRMKYLSLPNVLHGFRNNCIPIAGNINLLGIVSAETFSHDEYFLYFLPLKLFILRIIMRMLKQCNINPILTMILTQQRFLNMNIFIMRKFQWAKQTVIAKKVSRNPQNKKSFSS